MDLFYAALGKMIFTSGGRFLEAALQRQNSAGLP
jgi:hypothetical protein